MIKKIMALLFFVTFVTTVHSQSLHNCEWLSGSWGVRLYVRGGQALDTYVDDNKYDYVAGAKEIVESYPTTGHVITNFTNNAAAHLFTLRTNKNVDAIMGASGSVISEEFVPSLKNEQVIIDVIKVFKEAGKKVILYMNCMSIAARSSTTGAAVWNAYVTKYFGGNEHKATMNLIESYVKRFAELGVDGYWLDAFGNYGDNDREKAEFIQMIRNVNPNIAIGANWSQDFFKDAQGDYLKVDADGIGDANSTDYRIVKLSTSAEYESFFDFTSGHVTPLGQGAPPNSWAYEEFTIPDILDSPYSNGVLKHMFVPIRETWSSPRGELMFGQEQAYRFVKNITDAGGAITFSTTNNDGTTREDEETVLKYVNQKMEENYTGFTPYRRPPGAYLVGETRANAVLDQGNVWYHNNTPSVSYAIASEIKTGSLETKQSTLYTQGNASEYVSKFTRSSGSDAYIKFTLPEIIKAPSTAIFKIRVYTASNATLTNNNLRMILRKDGDTTTQISLSKDVTTMNEWVDYTFDMSGLTFTGDNYNEIYLSFASEDTDDDAKGNVYYFDAFQGQGPAPFNLKFIVKDDSNQLLSNSNVSIDSNYQTTNSFGEANFALLKGSYNVTVSKSGYFTKALTYNFDSDSVLYVDLQKSMADVEFRVKDGENIVRYATIKFNSVVQQANSLGIATYYEQSVNKDYTYTVEKTGYQSVSSTFTLSNDTTINIQLNTITGLNEIKENPCQIYPNPAGDNITIETSDFMKKVNVLDINGQLLLSQKVSGRKHKLELPKEKASVILINVIFEDELEITKKIIVDSGR